MAISSGVGPHYAWLTVGGASLPIESGSVNLTATKKASTFSGSVPIIYPGARAAFAGLGDNVVSIIVSTRGQTGTLITGEIDNVDFDYIGEQAIKFSGRDLSSRLHKRKSAEKWVNKQPSEIVQDLAGRVGLSVQIDPLALKMQRFVKDTFTKLTDSITYAMIIHKIADLMGAHWYVKGTTLYIVSMPASGAGYPINLSISDTGKFVSDALSLSVKRNVQAGKPIKVTVKSWHSHERKLFTGQATLGGNGSEVEYVYHLPNLMMDHVQQHAKAKAQDHGRHEIEVRARCVGDPTIDIAAPLSLRGSDFDGDYPIDSIAHTLATEHTMDIVAKDRSGGGGSPDVSGSAQDVEQPPVP